MNIEKLQIDDIQRMNNTELHEVRERCVQIHNKYWGSWPGISREEFIQKYDDLVSEMDKREMRKSDAPIDVTLFGIKSQRIVCGDSPGLAEAPALPRQGSSREIHKMIAKSHGDDPERIVVGIVAEPNEKDSEDDWETEEDIREALYHFMEKGGVSKINHAGAAIDACILEAFIAPVDYQVEGELVKKGSWVQALRVDADTHDKIQKGDLTGFSMAGTAIRLEDATG